MAQRKRGAQPGNSNATKGRRLSKRLLERLEERKKIDELADSLVDKAVAGDISAIKEVFDRVDGRAVQEIDLNAEVKQKSADELSDDELADIASRSS